MTVKKYLQQYGDLDKEISIKYEQLQKLYAVRMPQKTASTNHKTCHDLDTAFTDLEQQYTTDIKQLLQLKHDIQLIINSLNDSTQRIILIERYINLKQANDIAADVPCDVRTVYRWLNEAINALEKQHPDLLGTCC